MYIYRLIVAPRKFDVLKTNICPRREASRANMLVLITLNFKEATIRPIVPNINTLLSLLFTTKFSSARQFNNHIEFIFNFFKWKPLKSNVKFKKGNRLKPSKFNFMFQLFIFDKTLAYRIFSRTAILSIRVFFSNVHYGLIVSPRRGTLSRHVINLIQ